MKGWVLICFLPVLALAQDAQVMPTSSTSFEHYVFLYSTTGLKVSTAPADALPSFVERLTSKRNDFRRDKDFVEYIFTKTHRRFLKNYIQYSSFSDLLNKGDYNCLTGTALYALLLDHFSIPYRIIETNYHIFLMAETSDGEVLLEATDPAHGFTDSKAEIEKRITTYRQNATQKDTRNKRYYYFSFDLYNVVNLDEVLGLLYYNHAVIAYNNHEWVSTIDYLEKASALYQSPRLEEFSRIVLLSIEASKLDASLKENCVKKIQSVRKRKMEMVANVSY
ncbi:hypothetical protein [Ohtaekwangia sp.]|uniref:hypothetical protein n=1 Tax=Ohtaekwangia sp. TaxID=2066019 RepID=UPI002FDE232C